MTLTQLRRALDIAEIASVQVKLGPGDMGAVRGGVVGYCRDAALELIVHTPLGGSEAVPRLMRHPSLATADAHVGGPAGVALAWLRDVTGTVPIPGATTIEHALGS